MDTNVVFDEMLGQAVGLLEGNITHDGIILLKTAARNVYHQLIRCIGAVRHDGLPEEATSYENEVDELLSVLCDQDDTWVKYILVVVNGRVVRLLSGSTHSVEMPPSCICKGLLSIDHKNADAIIFTDGSRNMTLSDSVPPIKR